VANNKTEKKIRISIIGSGPSALILAAELNSDIFDISIFEKNNAPSRKFLVAGKGGFNLTHSESPETFINKYSPLEFIKPFFKKFNNIDTRKWFEAIGIKTFTGTSKRVFPEKGIKPNQVLEAILQKLQHNKVKFYFDHKWIDFDKSFNLVFEQKKENIKIKSDIVIFALGGASWKITGSDGEWLELFKKHEIDTKDFAPSNCAVKINWNKDFIQKHVGKPVKNIAIYYNDKYVKGEMVITSTGMEGGAIYAHAGNIREQLKNKPLARLFIDLKPSLDHEQILQKLDRTNKAKSLTKILIENLKLTKAHVDLIKHFSPKGKFMDNKLLARIIKNLPIEISGLASLDEAISTVGGLSMEAIDENLKIKKLPFHYAIGEMLDWDAPTGGYLLQASFSMGFYLAHYLNKQALAI